MGDSLCTCAVGEEKGRGEISPDRCCLEKLVGLVTRELYAWNYTKSSVTNSEIAYNITGSQETSRSPIPTIGGSLLNQLLQTMYLSLGDYFKTSEVQLF